MLAGEAVVAIWNDVAASGRAAFHDWHLHEHMAERLAVPGFLRARRYCAIDAATQPEFFTLYEVKTMRVVQDGAYLARLNAPTPWTVAMSAEFRNTTRAVAQVLESSGPGVGGVLLTLRFTAADDALDSLSELVSMAGRAARLTGAHLCRDDAAASGAPTVEAGGRTGDRPPPGWFALLEAMDPAALADALPDDDLREAGADDTPRRGLYRLEHLRP